MTETLSQEAIDRLDQSRLARVQAGLAAADCAAALLFDPINIRYATGTSRSSLWNFHGATRYVCVPAEGHAILFDNPGAHHHFRGKTALAECRPAATTCYWLAGPRVDAVARKSAVEIADLLQASGGAGGRLAVDRFDPALAAALGAEGCRLVPAGEIMERARAIKLPKEIALMRRSMAVCDRALAKIREDLAPGMTEQALWSRLQAVNAAEGGEWIETRLLSSGPRTNPWFQEAGTRVIEDGDLVAVDTDMVGPFGYLSDISRTQLCGNGRPKGEQRDLFGLAYEQLQHNLALMAPGRSFRDVTEQSWRLPQRFMKHRYLCVAHGAGMCNEYPNIVYPEDFETGGYDGVIEENMVLCIESYLGAEDGREGVKLEEQVLVTATGVESLSTAPFDERLL